MPPKFAQIVLFREDTFALAKLGKTAFHKAIMADNIAASDFLLSSGVVLFETCYVK